MLRKPAGLGSRADFQRVQTAGQSPGQSNGQRVRRAHVTLLALASSAPGFSIGYTVSRKVGNAVVRNRVRRRMREIVRLAQASVPVGREYVLIAAPSAANIDYEALQRDVLGAFAKLGRS